MDKMAELATKGEYGEMILLAVVVLFGWLAKRAIKTVDDKIEDNRHEVDKLRSEVEVKFVQMANSVKTLTDHVTSGELTNKEDISEIKSSLAYIRGYLESKADEEASKARNRRLTDN